MIINYLRFLFLAIIIVSCSSDNRTEYGRKIENQRLEKDKIFKFQQESPLRENQKINFTGLTYFPIDSSFRFVAEVDRLDSNEPLQMAYTNGKTKTYIPFADLKFNYEGNQYSVRAYQELELIEEGLADQLFIPFYDKTNGESTYGGGRYIDAVYPGGDRMILDFNVAYNPYCVFNAQFACPVPPKKNHIDLAIKAGEKMY